MPAHFVLVHPVTPPSFNKVGHSGCRWAWTREKKKWQEDFETLLMAASVPRGLSKVEVSAVLSFPTKRRRDEGNYRTLLEKCLADALVNGGWLPDDTPEFFTFGRVSFEKGASETRILLDAEL